ncbi:MFS transporter [Ruania zhangjianzhongii]|uniref:MFS transporter n=1 Tax=Ruania zhangjianzhongii TaxID=2603206 RepID=UPI0011CBD56E|nr:MFS transporter [Ruania zhangjianzhongii]
MSASEAQVGAPTRRDWLGLATLSVGLGMIVLDGTIVAVALPAIIADLDLDLTDAQWVNSSYAVVLAAFLLAAGKLADRWGRRRMFLAGLVVFITGSVLAALADSAGALISARVVQALGAAGIMPSTLSTVNATFRGRYRAAAFGVWGAVISGAAAVGPLAGGALTSYASWRWIFLVNVPVCAVVLLAATVTVRPTHGVTPAQGADVAGALLSGIGLGALVFAVIEGPKLGWWAPQAELTVLGSTWPADAPISVVPVLLAVAVVFLILFVAWERHRRRVRRSALLDLTLFRLPTFTWGNLTAAAVAVGEFAIVFTLPLYLVNARGLSVMAAGGVLAAMALGAFGAGAAARHLADRIGTPGVVLAGLGLEVVGAGLVVLAAGPTTPAGLIAAPLVLYGLGLGLASAQLTGTVLRDVPTEMSGQGSATQSTVRQVGSALGTALAGSALSVALALTLPSALAAAGVPGTSADQVATTTRTSAGSTIAQLRDAGAASPFGSNTDQVVAALIQGFADATRITVAFAAVFLLIGLAGAVRVWLVARRPASAAE